MKKYTRFSIVALLVVSVILMSVSSVFAYSSSSTDNTWADPTAGANGKYVSFSSTVLTPYELPGTIDNDATMILPIGFDGFAQFGGSGIQISGLATSTESVKLTFAFPTYQYGWSGSISKWDGTKWVALNTTIVAPTGENFLYYATTPKAGNGIYALIVHFTEPAD